jgi:hypothetical protein
MGDFMKNLIMFSFVFMTLVASNAFAISDDELIATCLKEGTAKLELYAQGYGCHIQDVEADSIDNRWLLPSKYVWYVGVIPCANNLELTKMVQYSGGKCF